ncbi:MAG: WYL domain-containing protein [Saprospiraceae bacterium]|nr:WYL domain-containing protein [Candidatus Opimibacter skivensis]
MATNKHATIRYQVLDRCFRNPGRKYFIEDLVNACNDALEEYTGNEDGVKRRQVLEDIKFMESSQGWNIPLERIRDGHRVYFRYEDRSFSINGQPLNPAEESQLKEALLTLSRFKGLPQFGWIDELITKLDSGLALSKSKDRIIQFDENPNLLGLEKISPLYEAIRNTQVLEIEYQSFSQGTNIDYTLHPYFLKQYNNRWFLFGKNDDDNEIMNVALDRIKSFKHSKTKYRPNTMIDFDAYFKDIVGVSLPKAEGLLNIQVRVNNRRLPWILTKPIHSSQRELETNHDSTLISLDLMPNKEFEALLLSFGEDVEVIKPKSLRSKLAKKIKQMNTNYTSFPKELAYKTKSHV